MINCNSSRNTKGFFPQLQFPGTHSKVYKDSSLLNEKYVHSIKTFVAKMKIVILLFVNVLVEAVIFAECKSRNSPQSDDWETYKVINNIMIVFEISRPQLKSKSFQKHHAKKYRSSRHEGESRKHFERRRKMIKEHNERHAKGEVKYTTGMFDFFTSLILSHFICFKPDFFNYSQN